MPSESGDDVIYSSIRSIAPRARARYYPEGSNTARTHMWRRAMYAAAARMRALVVVVELVFRVSLLAVAGKTIQYWIGYCTASG